MTPTQQRRAEQQRLPFRAEGAAKRRPRHEPDANQGARSIVAAVEPHSARMVGDTAARLARELEAPLVFVTVRPPLAGLDDPHAERRLTRELFRAQKALDTALAAASRHGVMPTGEVLVGDAPERITDFARTRQAWLVVTGQAFPEVVGATPSDHPNDERMNSPDRRNGVRAPSRL